ncbi:MAG TPA: LysM peptidoglycan-binding domain-containing protein [Roseiflexaceae bacterium]|nr:LysM peptidoglycan-binding domain-containing protein [Roseiflexaceae bacterium]
MSQPLVIMLLALALVLPVLGSIALRLLAPRLSSSQFVGAAALIFGIALASVLVLARANVPRLQVGDLSLLLPAVAPAAEEPLPAQPQPTASDQPPTAEPAPTAELPTIAPTEPPTAAATVAPTVVPTEEPTAAPTEPPPTATLTPEPPTPTPQPVARRTYVVQRGDTLRGIAAQFDVTVQALLEANNLTAEQADALRVGQELIIP